MSKTLRNMVKNSDRIFFYGLHLLSKRKRKAMYAVYSFRRHIGDIALSDDAKAKKIDLLNAWQKELCHIYEGGVPTSKIGREIFDVCRPFGLPKEDFITELKFLREDLTKGTHLFSEQEFRQCCDCFSGAMIRQVLRVLGCKKESMIDELSACLGLAVGITMVLCNMKDDANRGKLYLPDFCLRKAEISSDNPQEVVTDNRLGVARAELAKIGQENYFRGLELINNLDEKMARRMRDFIYVYYRYFEIMEKRGWEVISPKPALRSWDKIRLLVKAYMEK